MGQDNSNIPIGPEILVDLANARMPFGKYQGRILCDLPQPYLVWLAKKGFPKGQEVLEKEYIWYTYFLFSSILDFQFPVIVCPEHILSKPK